MMLQKLTLELPLMKVKNVCAQTHYYKISLGYSCIVYVRSASFDQIWEQIIEVKHQISYLGCRRIAKTN